MGVRRKEGQGGIELEGGSRSMRILKDWILITLTPWTRVEWGKKYRGTVLTLLAWIIDVITERN